MNDRLLEGDPDPFTDAPATLLTDRAVRALTIVLPENEWQVLRRVEPDPLEWLRRQLRHRLEQEHAINRTVVSD